MEQHHLIKKVKLFTKAILSAAKETRRRRKHYIPGCKNSTVLSAESGRRLNLAPQMTTQLPTTKEKQNLSDTFQQTRSVGYENLYSLNMENDSYKPRKLTKLLNGDSPEKAQTVQESEGELITQKKAANCLAELYREESNVKLPRERTSLVREQQAQLQEQPTSGKCMNQPTSMKEIEVAIKQLEYKKAPGPYGVTNDIIKQFRPAAKKNTP